MSLQALEARIAALENEVARLREMIDEKEKDKAPGWKRIVGTFEGDPYYAEAMRLGREYRESTRPKLRKRRKKK
jgi:hypothetical protein